MKLFATIFLFGGMLLAQVPNAIVPAYLIPNDTSVGTTQFKLAKLASGAAVITASTDTFGAIGVCTVNCGTSGWAGISFIGLVPLVMDATATANHYVILSASSAGEGHDTGATTYPTSGEVKGIVQTGCTGAHCTAEVLLVHQIQAATGSGAVAFPAVTAGTNTSALVIGTGGSLSATGSGSISATLIAGSAPAYFATGTDAANLTGAVADARLTAGVKVRQYGGVFTGSLAVSGSTTYLVVPHACTISAVNIWVDTGTATFTLWRLAASGTALPTVTNTISTSGIGISTGTYLHTATVSDFTSLAISAGDKLGVHLNAVTGTPALAGYTIECGI